MRNRHEIGFIQYFKEIDEVGKNWGWFLALGILMTLLGIGAVGSSASVTLFSVFFVGIALAIAGVAQMIHGFWARKWKGVFLSLLLGALYLVMGVLLAKNPLQSAVTLTLLIGAFCLTGGLFRIITSLALRFDHWGWVLTNGLVTFVLGILILSDWPLSGLWVIGLFVGIDLIFLGWSWILFSLAARKHAK